MAERLRGVGVEPPGMRMIDGEIALPDEAPPADWRELRVAAADGSGMVTIRRDAPATLALTVWSNADTALKHLWKTLGWAIAETTGGEIELDNRRTAPRDFAQQHGITT